MSNKTFLLVIGVIIAAIAGVLVFTNQAQSPGDEGLDEVFKVTDVDHQKGAEMPVGIADGSNNEETDSKVVFMEYGDFECSACAQAYPYIEQAMSQYGDQVTFVYRHFPLTQTHDNAMVAHRAAEAAAKQDKFFDMYDQLFTKQQQWAGVQNPQDIMRTYAQEIGLDMEQYEVDYNDPATLERINKDLGTGQKVGVRGTPSLFVNGEQLSVRNFGDIESALEAAIADADSDETDTVQ